MQHATLDLRARLTELVTTAQGCGPIASAATEYIHELARQAEERRDWRAAQLCRLALVHAEN